MRRSLTALLLLALAPGLATPAAAQLWQPPARGEPFPPMVRGDRPGDDDANGGDAGDEADGRPPYRLLWPYGPSLRFEDEGWGARLPPRPGNGRPAAAPSDAAPPVEAEEPPRDPPDTAPPGERALPRGRAADARAFEIGEPLPDGVPHVTLDWRTYGLPRPGPGQVYARVGRDILVIDASTRVVRRVVEPGRDAE